jgi:hypothetical protein
MVLCSMDSNTINTKENEMERRQKYATMRVNEFKCRLSCAVRAEARGFDLEAPFEGEISYKIAILQNKRLLALLVEHGISVK